jgi:hypothetical protein
VRDQVFGNLYLSEKQGAATFSRDDEEVVKTLAAAQVSRSRTRLCSARSAAAVTGRRP